MREKLFCIVLLLFGTLCLSEQEEYFRAHLCKSTSPATNRKNAVCGQDQAKDTIDYLKNGEQYVELKNEYRDLTLLVGNTGTGKSTLSLYAAGDLADLRSVQKSRSVFLIESTKESNAIGNSTTVSQTIFPALVRDEANNAFYDCPGFDDTRNASIDIASTYFIKKVVDHAQTIRFVLVANYNDLLLGESRDNFPALVKHLHHFIKKLANYRDSISLVATKAPNEPFDNLQQNIVEFLREYRDEQVKTQDTDPLARYAVELLDILLTSQDKGATFDRIGVFNKPTKAGVLTDIPAMVEGRAKLREMILKRTKYSQKIDGDFGYTISDASKLKLGEIVQEINGGITTNVQNIANEIQAGFKRESRNLGDLILQTKRFHLSYDTLYAITRDTKNLTSELLIERFTNATKDLDVAISREYLTEVSTRSSYIHFLQDFTDKPLPVDLKEWLNGLDGCLEYLEMLKSWFKFLSDIYTAYSQYEFRRDLTKYNVADLNNWGTSNSTPGIEITADNFGQFVSKQTAPAVSESFKPTGPQLETLNNLLDITLKQQTSVSLELDDTKLVVKGDYVRTSDFDLKQYGDKLKQLHIFALHTLFIDSNISVSHPIDIVIIATNWHIWGDHAINLIGLDAEPVAKGRAAKGGESSKKATSGLPGLSGKNSGNFIGLGESFTNGDKLVVNLIGGSGSRGQDGGLGYNASEADVTFGVFKNPSSSGDSELGSRNYRRYESLDSKGCRKLDTSSEKCDYEYYVYSNCNGYGGDGGQGGYGGRPGLGKIVELGAQSAISLLFQNGTVGLNGTGGPTNETNPNKIKLHYSSSNIRTAFGDTWTGSFKELSRDADDSCPKDKSVDGANADGIVEPDAPVYRDLAYVINDFEAFVRENQANPLKRAKLAQFVDLIWNNTDISRAYSTKAFVNELQLIEDQFYRLQNELDLSVYYRSISDRIERFVGYLNASNITMSRDDRTVFNYLYTSAWSKYLALGRKESFMIIDIKAELKLTMEDIENVNRAKRVNITDNHRTAYRNEINAKIDDATSLVNLEILPKIAEISASFDQNLDAIVNETIKRRKEGEKARDEYIEQQKKLGTKMAWSLLFGSLKMVGQVASMTGPIGMAANGVINGATQIADGFLEDPLVKGVPSIPKAAKDALDSFTEAYKQNNVDKLKALDKLINETIDIIVKKPEEFKDFSKEIEDLQKRLNDEVGKDIGDYVKIRDELESKIEKQMAKIPKDETAMLKHLKYVEDSMKVIQSAFDIYDKARGDQAKIDEVTAAIEKNQENLQALEKFQTQIYAKLWPMVNQMRSALSRIAQKLPAQPGAVLAIQQWNIKSILRDTKFELARLTKGFDAQDDLLQTFVKLDDAFATLIDIYDRIDSYTDQEKLGDYIAAVGSAGMEVVNVKDVDLQSDVNRLDLIITSNVLLTRYKAVTDAFKQTVFPFISSFVQDIQLPTSLQLGNDTSVLVNAATEQLTNIKKNIIKYNKAEINDDAKLIYQTTFDQIQPLYTWNFDEYSKPIIDIFNGSRSTLSADIRRGFQENAIKFNRIELLIKAPTAENQTKIDELLTNVTITLLHSGHSRYRCGANYYTIESPGEEISYSYRKKDGKPNTTNKVYDMIAAGDMALSPYTMWSIQMTAKPKNDTIFVELNKLASGVQLILVGGGQYVDIDAKVCNEPLTDYYTKESL